MNEKLLTNYHRIGDWSVYCFSVNVCSCFADFGWQLIITNEFLKNYPLSPFNDDVGDDDKQKLGRKKLLKRKSRSLRPSFDPNTIFMCEKPTEVIDKDTRIPNGNSIEMNNRFNLHCILMNRKKTATLHFNSNISIQRECFITEANYNFELKQQLS